MQSGCWRYIGGHLWSRLSPDPSFSLPCWEFHSQVAGNIILLPKPPSLEKHKISWTCAFRVLHSFRQPDVSSGFHLFKAISAHDLIREWLEERKHPSPNTSVIVHMCLTWAIISAPGKVWIEGPELKLLGCRSILTLCNPWRRSECYVFGKYIPSQ